MLLRPHLLCLARGSCSKDRCYVNKTPDVVLSQPEAYSTILPNKEGLYSEVQESTVRR